MPKGSAELTIFNNNIPYYVFFDGFYHIHRNSIITLQDLEKNKNNKERLVSVSDPELERNNEAYSIPFKKYFAWQNSKGFTFSKISSFKILEKFYNIYIIENKDKDINKKNDMRKISQIKLEEEEFQTSTNKKLENIKLMEENASVSSVNVQALLALEYQISELRIRKRKIFMNMEDLVK